MVYRIFTEKREEHAFEARHLYSDITRVLGIKSLTAIRIFNRYDCEGITPELFETAVHNVFSEPQIDIVTESPDVEGAAVFAVEYLPGQYDQRADSAAQCIQIISGGERPLVKSARVYALYGDLSDADIATIKKYVINPVDSREAESELPDTLKMVYDIPTEVAVVEGFIDLTTDGLKAFISANGLAMDLGDLEFCQDYFKREQRNPTITEIKVIDTYWSDHCRHTTFGTIIDDVEFEDPLLKKAYEDYLAVRAELGITKPICMMDLGTIAAKALKKRGILTKLDESEEINACTVKIDITVDGKTEPWLLLFKNETHNHPTEIEPFGGAATCIGGAIRDPLSGRSYVYAAMRITGASDPTVAVSETIPGKLPQRKLVTTAAQGYSSYGNQIGLATGIVDEIYHPGYAAKHMEIGAVLGAAPAKNVRRERPSAGDIVILLGGATGRDGIGGATGSSKAHDSHSVETCGAEVQKGNAPEERKLQRLFRNGDACRMIKRCNDFGAGGVSVAIGELADGLDINLNVVPKKYEGLDGTELAISESQERMAVVVAPGDVDAFMALAYTENLNATVVAKVTDTGRLRMEWNGKAIVDISREFLDTNGAEKHISIKTQKNYLYEKAVPSSLKEGIEAIAGDINSCSRRGLGERFDSTIGAGSVLMPYGGKYQATPIQAMAHKIPVEKGHTDDCSVMSWGYNPYVASAGTYYGGFLAVVESYCKLIATGAKCEDAYFTFQEYFGKTGSDGTRWGKPFGALLGAFEAQMQLGIASIGGKDSMSGTFENLDVPPTLVSFGVTADKADAIISPEFKEPGHCCIILKPQYDENGLPVISSLKAVAKRVTAMLEAGKAVACYALGFGGIGDAVFKMAAGNGLGFKYNDELSLPDIFAMGYGAFILEVTEATADDTIIGVIDKEPIFSYKEERLSAVSLNELSADTLEGVYPVKAGNAEVKAKNISYEAKEYNIPAVKCVKPRVLIPVFPGTNCEFDSAKVVADAGGEPEIMVINNLSADGIGKSVERFAKELKDARMIFLPGGFSGGDEPDGSGKFITAFFRNEAIKEGVGDLLENRDGLMLGICNGFQALIKLGLVPYGKIIDTDVHCPTLAMNTIGRHQSRIVRTRVASNLSPWLKKAGLGQVYNVPISHGEGRFYCEPELLQKLMEKGQIATQYVDNDGNATMDIDYNPNGSVCAIEGITSPDGRVLGKMGHSERIGSNLYRNVPGNYDIKLFESAVSYFKGL